MTAMTNPSAQTMLELDKAFQVFEAAFWISMKEHNGTEPVIARRAGIEALLSLLSILPRTASAPAAMRDRDAIARIINPDLFVEYDLLVKKGTLAKNGARWAEVVFGQKIAALHAKADAILALAAPEEASTDTNESVQQEIAYFEEHADRFADAHKGIVEEASTAAGEAEHRLVNGSLKRESSGIVAKCVCGWESCHFSSFAASTAFQDHQEAAPPAAQTDGVSAAAAEIEKLTFRLNYMHEKFGAIDWDAQRSPQGIASDAS